MYYFKYKTTNITGIPRGKNHELNSNDSYSTVSYYEPARTSKMWSAVKNCEHYEPLWTIVNDATN